MACVFECVFWSLMLTAGEDQRTGMFIHWEIMKLQLTLSVDGHPERQVKGETEKHLDYDSHLNMFRMLYFTLHEADTVCSVT